jgi:hypothetical protein
MNAKNPFDYAPMREAADCCEEVFAHIEMLRMKGRAGSMSDRSRIGATYFQVCDVAKMLGDMITPLVWKAVFCRGHLIREWWEEDQP